MRVCFEFWVVSRGSQNIKGLNVEHWRCRKSDVEIKHPIKLSEAAKCNNTAAGPRPSTDGQTDRQTQGVQTQSSLWGWLCRSPEPINWCHYLRLEVKPGLFQSVRLILASQAK